MEHDASYKLLFSHARMVEDLLRGFVHEAWVRDVDLTTLERVSDSQISDDLRSRRDDLVWRVRWGPDWLYLYLLLEFQSTVDPYMAVRVLVYVGLLYQALIRAGQLPASGNLPPVVPIVLYNGRGRWTAPQTIAGVVETMPRSLVPSVLGCAMYSWTRGGIRNVNWRRYTTLWRRCVGWRTAASRRTCSACSGY